MYCILARNRGMWGYDSVCKDKDGNVILFNTQEEARAKAFEMNESGGRVNNFTEYFAIEYK